MYLRVRYWDHSCSSYILTTTENSFALGYADDYKFLSTNNKKFKDDISQLQIWCEQNQMSLIADEYNMLKFKVNQKKEICGKEVKSEENQKDLGLIFTQKLSWLEMQKKTTNEVDKIAIFCEKIVSSKTIIRAKINCYTGYEVPILIYGSQALYYDKSEMKIIKNAFESNVSDVQKCMCGWRARGTLNNFIFLNFICFFAS